MINSSTQSSDAHQELKGRGPDVSLIMPLLDAMPFLTEALNSLESQGDVSIEVIAVDAGSTDGTLELLEAHEMVRVIPAQGTSQTEALNIGFAQSTGKIFGWLNGDDILANGALGWVANWFGSRPDAKLMYGDSMAINGNGRHYGLRANVRKGQYDQLLHGDFIVQPSAFWRREVYEKLGPLDESLDFTFDYAFFLDVAQQWELHYEPIVFSLERVHGSAKTSNGGEIRAEELHTVMANHGRPGVPMAFQPEVSAVHAQTALRKLRAGDRDEAVSELRRVASEGRPVGFTGVHLLASLIGGSRGTAEARLVSNFLRSAYRRRSPAWPTDTRI